MSVRSNKARGAKTEILARDWLTDTFGWPVERIALNGVTDRGDLGGVPGLVVEVKSSNLARPPWREWVRQATTEGENVGLPWVVLYRPPRSPDPETWLTLHAENGLPYGPYTAPSLALIPFRGSWVESMTLAREFADHQFERQFVASNCADHAGVVHMDEWLVCLPAPVFFARHADHLATL